MKPDGAAGRTTSTCTEYEPLGFRGIGVLEVEPDPGHAVGVQCGPGQFEEALASGFGGACMEDRKTIGIEGQFGHGLPSMLRGA